MIDFYDNDMSVCAQKVRLVLYEKDVSFERHHLNLRAGDQFKPDYLKLNPNAVVPTLVDRGHTVIESTVIIEYLDDAYPDPSLSPETPILRALMRRWLIKPDSGLSEYLMGDVKLEEAVVKARDNLWILAGGKSLAGVKRTIDRKDFGGERMLAEALEPLSNDFDYIIVDTSPGWDPLRYARLAG